jgi:hypothetical protein
MSTRLALRSCAAALLLGACATSSHPAPDPAPATRPATPVAAPASRTWDVALSVLKEDGAELSTQDPATRSAVTKELTIPFRYQGVASDCGEGSVSANQVVMALRVTGDEQRSDIQVTGRYYLRGLGPIRFCQTKEFWESNLEQRIRDRAEGK